MSHPGSREKLRDLLSSSCRVFYDDIDNVIDALEAAGLVVTTDYHVPTTDELFGMYSTLGAAYLRHRIKVRWVMCAEIHDALAAQYRRKRYVLSPDFTELARAEIEPSVEVLEFTVRTVMEANLHWNDHSRLFGIPIRIDPAARRVMFEITEEGE